MVVELAPLPKATAFKAKLEHYQSIIPANNSAFRAYFAGLQTGYWTKGYWSDDRNGFQVFRYKGLEKVYDEARAKGMRDQIDYLLSVYFPQGSLVNHPPVIVSSPVSQTIPSETAFSIPMVVTDPDTPQDHLSFTLHYADPSRPNEIEGLSFNSKTGELYGQNDIGHDAERSPLKISVFDGTTEVFTDPFQLFFREPDKPGFAITNLVDLQVTAGQTLIHSFNIQGSIEGDFHFSVRSLNQPNNEFKPSWLQKDSLGITLTPSNADIGEYKDLFIKVETPDVHIRSVLFSIRVVPSDDSLRLVGSPQTKLMAMRPYDFKPSLLKGSQVEGVVSFSASNLPSWLRLDASTGRIFGPPLSNDGGTYSGIMIEASNGIQSAVFGPFSIEVSYDAKLKVLNLDSAYTFLPGEDIDIPIVLEDLDGDDTYMSDQYGNLRFAESKPEWIDYDGASRPASLYGTVPVGVAGSYTIEFNVHGGKPFQFLPITVVDTSDSTPPSAPSIIGTTQTTNTTPTLRGEAEAGSKVAIYSGTTSLGAVTADSQGVFSFTLSSALSVGAYNITAKATDSAGNISQSSSVFNLVIITDDVKPVITLKGLASVTHELGTTYTDAGVTASDNVDGDITESVSLSGTVDVNTTGTYTLTYSASDAAGNGATSVTRTVRVVEKAGFGVKILSYTQFPFGFSFDTGKDKSYIVEATGDLLKWNQVQTFQGTGSAVKFTDIREELFEKQYYRVKTQQ